MDTDRQSVIQLYQFDTPIGPMHAGTSNNGLCLLEFTDLSKRIESRIEEETNGLHRQVEKQLSEYFEHKRKDFDLPLDIPGTSFQQKVWLGLLKIPYGTTRSYKSQSIALGKPEAIRAVARANSQNRIAIIIPCHRVIGTNGSLTGYAAGLHRKKWLIDHESSSKQGTLDF